MKQSNDLEICPRSLTVVSPESCRVAMYVQESLANANVSARQQCMYEGRYRRNMSSVDELTNKQTNTTDCLLQIQEAQLLLRADGPLDVRLT